MESPLTTTGKGWVLTQEAFDALLGWLGPDRDRAAKRYEEIRRRLIRFFTGRRCNAAEDLADETMNRVARKVAEGLSYVGDTAPYFYRVAHNVYLEHIKAKPHVPPPPPPPSDADQLEREHRCLELCIGRLQSRSRELIRDFYLEEKSAKIEHRRRLAERLGMTPNALRIQAHRIRQVLHDCVRQCLNQHELS